MILYVIAGTVEEYRECLRVMRTSPEAARMVTCAADLPAEAGHAVVFYGAWQNNPAWGRAEWLKQLGTLEQIRPAA